MPTCVIRVVPGLRVTKEELLRRIGRAVGPLLLCRPAIGEFRLTDNPGLPVLEHHLIFSFLDLQTVQQYVPFLFGW